MLALKTTKSPLGAGFRSVMCCAGRHFLTKFEIFRFFNQNFHDFRVIPNYKKKLIKSYLDESDLPYAVNLMEEDEYLGTVGGLKLFSK